MNTRGFFEPAALACWFSGDDFEGVVQCGIVLTGLMQLVQGRNAKRIRAKEKNGWRMLAGQKSPARQPSRSRWSGRTLSTEPRQQDHPASTRRQWTIHQREIQDGILPVLCKAIRPGVRCPRLPRYGRRSTAPILAVISHNFPYFTRSCT